MFTTPFYRTRTLNVSTANKAHTTNFIQSNLVHTLKKISQLQPILPKKMYLLLPVSVIARLFRKVTHQTCHSLNKHSPLHTRLFARLARPFFNSPLMLSFKLPCQRSCPALRCQIKSFWLESRIARLIIMLIEQFSVFFSLLHTVQFGKKAYSV